MNLPAKLAPGLWRLGTYHIAAFLVRGRQGACLFEVGVSGTVATILAQLDSLGLDREEVRWVVLSHAHADHATGQAGLLAGLPQATLLLTAASQKYLAKPSTADDFATEDAYSNRALARAGDPADTDARPGELLPQPWQVVEPGFELDLGDLTLRLLAAEGHVPGGLTALVPQLAAVLASDSAGFVTRRPPGFPLYFVSYAAYRDTLESIAELKPEVLAGGHQDWFSGPAVNAYLQSVVQDLEREHAFIHTETRRGCTQQAIAQQIFDHYYQDELLVYSPESIMQCCQLLVRRSLEDE